MAPVSTLRRISARRSMSAYTSVPPADGGWGKPHHPKPQVCTVVRLTLRPPPAPPRASLCLRRQPIPHSTHPKPVERHVPCDCTSDSTLTPAWAGGWAGCSAAPGPSVRWGSDMAVRRWLIPLVWAVGGGVGGYLTIACSGIGASPVFRTVGEPY